LKILFLSHRIPFPPNKGEKIRTFHQLKHLVDAGHQVSVIAPYEDDSELDFFKALEQQYCEKVIGIKLGAKPRRLITGIISGKALSVSNFYSKALQLLLDGLLNQHQFDVIICTASSMAEYIFKSSTLTTHKPPVLLMDFMDLDSDKWRQYAQRSAYPMKWVYLRETKLIGKFEQQIAQTFNACFFITEAEKALFCKTIGKVDNIYAVENGMDTQVFKPAVNKVIPEQPILLFTGVMDYAPNVDAVVWFVDNIWQQVLKKWPQAQFYIAGMSPSDKVKALEVNQGIVVTGFVDDILPYFDKASVFVGPFRIARGVQNKVLQAFACGLPVVSTAMGAEGIRCKDGESILIAHTADEFMQKLTVLHEDKILVKTMTDNALNIIQQHYAWDGVLQPFDDVLHQQVGGLAQ
jgi:sugar transferase (PEP-CTERM/EpsH1 system associated)